jgi:2-C-methyl-D-erythritol 4-phosphate cytidylyltransferase
MADVRRFVVILAAGGQGTRFGGDKLLVDVGGTTVLRRSIDAFVQRSDVRGVVLVHPPGRREEFEAAVQGVADVHLVRGGNSRAASVARGLRTVRADFADAEFVAIHDAARPSVPQDVIDRVFHQAMHHGAAVPGVPVTDTIKEVSEDGRIVRTPPRERLVAVQTPQVARTDWLVDAVAKLPEDATPTDDAAVLELAGYPVHVVPGDVANRKITTRADLEAL